MKKKKKYSYGTNKNGVRQNHIQSPSEALTENDINMAHAEFSAATNPWALGVKALGSSLLSTMFALGGQTGMLPVEVEGDEVAETRDGDILKFIGKDHSKGGIDINLPSGTKIYSKRIKVDKVTLADRKLQREKKNKKAIKKQEKHPMDQVLKNSSNRIRQITVAQDKKDIELQEYIKNLETPKKGKFPLGESNLTLGDALGFAGNAYAAFSPYFETLKNRSEDTVNVNSFLDYGKDALNTIDKSKGYIAGQRDNSLQGIELARRANLNRGRNSSRGVNTMRALDISGTNSANIAESKIYDAFSQQMMGLLGQQKTTQLKIDKTVMTGEEQRDLNDRKDRDNYNAQVSTDKKYIGKFIGESGKEMNTIKANKVQEKLMNDLFKYLKFNSKTGEVSQKMQSPEEMFSAPYQFKDDFIGIINPLTGKEFTRSDWEFLPPETQAMFLNKNN